MDGFGDLLGVRAAGRSASGRMTTCRSLKYCVSPASHLAAAPSEAVVATKPILARVSASFSPSTEVDRRRGRRRDQLRQSIRNLRAIRLALGPAVAVPVILRELFLAGLIPALSDLEKAFAVLVAIDVFGEHGPLAGAGLLLRLRLGLRQTELLADMIAASFQLSPAKLWVTKTFAIGRVRFNRQATITGTVSRTRTQHFSALHVAPEQLGDLRD